VGNGIGTLWPEYVDAHNVIAMNLRVLLSRVRAKEQGVAIGYQRFRNGPESGWLYAEDARPLVDELLEKWSTGPGKRGVLDSLEVGWYQGAWHPA